jgi:acyl-CoA synthetase (AMP-forming)/AMP-acid ligase II
VVKPNRKKSKMSLAAAELARTRPNDMALVDERTLFTWADLDQILNRATNQLLAAEGIHRCAVFAANSAEAVIAHLAGIHAGVSTVPVNFHFTTDELSYILQDSGAQMLFVGPETLERAQNAARIADITRIVAWRSRPTPGVVPWNEWLAQASAAEPPTTMEPRPHLHYTSGTTGQPKGVETPPNMFVRKANIADFFAAQKEAIAATNGGPHLVVSPLYHTGPLGSVRQLAGGASVVVMSRFDPEEVLKAIERYRVKSTIMVPTHFQRLLALPADVRIKYDLSSLEMVGHTGAACPIDVKRAMIDWWGPVLTEAYGATEAGTTNVITSLEWLRKPGSVGRTLPPFEVLVVSEEGEQLAPNQSGQLYFRDTTGRGLIYHNDEAKTKAAHLEPGVFTLGEVGFVDEEGYVFITDRVSDMIISGGVNIYPAEVEQALLQHPAIDDVAVIGVPSADMGEEVKALVIPTDKESPPHPRELDQFCRAKLAGFKCPKTYEIVDDIGRNAMGKVNKRILRQTYWPTERTIG